MAWIEPKTDWSAGDLVRPADMIRICGNINYLLGSEELRTDWTADDFVFIDDWHAIVDACEELATAESMPLNDITDAVTSYNFILVEEFTVRMKRLLDLKPEQGPANNWAGDHYSDAEIYSGGYYI